MTIEKGKNQQTIEYPLKGQLEDYLKSLKDSGYSDASIKTKRKIFRCASVYLKDIRNREDINLSAYETYLTEKNITSPCYLSALKVFKDYLIDGKIPTRKGIIKTPLKKTVLLPEIEIYLNLCRRKQYAKRTINGFLKILPMFNDFINHKKIALKEVTEQTIKMYQDYLKSLGYAKESIKTCLKRVRELFDWLSKTGEINLNPFSRLKRKLFSIEGFPDNFKKYYYQFMDEVKNEGLKDGCKYRIKNLYQYLLDNGIEDLTDVRKDDLKSFILILKESNNYKPSSINGYITTLRNFFGFLSKQGVVINHTGVLRNMRTGKHLHRNILTKKEICALFNVPVKNMYEFMMKTMFVVFYSTGIRLGELKSLKPCDINFMEKHLIIYESKTNKERFVRIGDVGLKYLKIYIEHVRDKINPLSASDRIFVSICEKGEIGQGTINKYLRYFCTQAGIKKHISTHCFRHTYGSHLLENGLGIKQVADLLGHSDLMTTERYTRLNPARLRKTILKCHPLEREG